MRVNDIAPGTNLSFCDLNKNLYKVDIRDQNQPVLRISSAEKNHNMIRSGGEQKKTNSQRLYFSCRVPEFMLVQPILS